MNPYRNSNNVLKLRSLFLETGGGENAVYSLKDQDQGEYRSLKRLYLETDDPTEYRFYTVYLDGLKHWEALCAAKWFKPYVAQWRKELLVRLQSQALVAIRQEAANEGKNSFAANKYLLEKGWEASPNPRGRPTKQEISDAAQTLALDEKRIAEDYERLALSNPSGPAN